MAKLGMKKSCLIDFSSYFSKVEFFFGSCHQMSEQIRLISIKETFQRGKLCLGSVVVVGAGVGVVVVVGVGVVVGIVVVVGDVRS